MPEAKRIPEPVDLSIYNSDKAQKGTYRDADVNAFGLPMDVPIYCTVHRLMVNNKEHRPPKVMSRALVGHTITLEDPTWGVKVYVRRGMGDDKTLKIMIEDGDGIECVATYERKEA